MSHVATTATLAEAQHAVERLFEFLIPVCDRVEVAGSVRRRQDDIGDIEVVAIAGLTNSADGKLFEGPTDLLQQLTDRVERGQVDGLKRPEPIAKRTGKSRKFAWGERWKQMVVLDRDRWYPVDLFITTKAQWGSILAIRTGPSAFSKLLVTPRDHGGAMPRGHRQADGFLEHNQDGNWERIWTPEEGDYFEALGLPWWDPRIRSERLLRDHLGQRKV